MAEESNTQPDSSPELCANETNVTDKCDCASGGTVVAFQADGGRTRCNVCGKILPTEQGRPPSIDEAERILAQTFANHLPFLPDTPETSLTDSSIGEDSGDITRPPDTHSVEEEDDKNPVHGWYSIHLLFILMSYFDKQMSYNFKLELLTPFIPFGLYFIHSQVFHFVALSIDITNLAHRT